MLMVSQNFYEKRILKTGNIHIWLKYKYRLNDIVRGFEYNLIFKLIFGKYFGSEYTF